MIGAIIIFFFYLAACKYGLDILVGLVYDEEVARVVDYNLLYFFPMLLATTVYINLVVVVKIVWDRILRSPGTLLRFRIIGFFFLSIVIPALLFIIVFNIFFNRFIVIFDNQAIIKAMENKKWILTQEIERLKIRMTREFDRQLSIGFSNVTSRGLTYVGVHDMAGERLYHFKINSFSLQSVPQYSFSTLLSNFEDRFTSYDKERGFIYQVRRQRYKEKIYHFTIITKVSPYLRNDINENFLVIRQVKQFDLLLYPFKIFTIAFLIYVYSQIFSIIAIAFYYSSNRYINPIAQLIKATRQVIKGNYKLSLNRLTRYMDNNEIKELLESFSHMTYELTRYRRRLERISNIEAWKDVSQRLAHEIKNPLTPILLAKEQIEKYLIKNDFSGYHQMQENFLFIETEIKRILSLLDEFKILAEQKLINLEWVKTQDIMAELQRFMGNYEFINYEGSDQFQKSVYIDKDKMIRVFFNLLGNAIDSLKEMKSQESNRDLKVRVVIYSESVSPTKEMTFDHSYKNLIFEIWDNGIGIPVGRRNEVFKPYITFKSSGTGLGLTICNEIITLHHGEIENFSLPLSCPSSLGDSFNDKGEFREDVLPANKERMDIENNVIENSYWTVFRITIPYIES